MFQLASLARVKAEDILSRFQQFAEETEFETIQLGYDGDPFARRERGIAMLKQLARMGKHINFSTKALIEGPILDALSDIRCYMQTVGTTLSALVSLSCWDSAPAVEPHTPSPYERMLTVANLKRIGIPVFIAVRPVLPDIPDSEYECIVDEGIRAGCEGFILGPLYADTDGRYVRFIPPAVLEKVPSRTESVSWSAHAPMWTRYEDANRLRRLLRMIKQKEGRTFLSSADAVAFVHQAIRTR
ncbi:MAG: radical SAM protein [Chloroflexi bacterium]|nr:MAG: radical SAM protein [Chloroflexota bacterium]